MNTWAPPSDGWRCGLFRNGERWGWSWNWANDYVVAQTILLPPFSSCGELCAWEGVSPYPTIALRIHSPLLFPLLGENANGMAPGLCKHSLVIREFTFRIPPQVLQGCRGVDFLRISIGRAGSLKELKWER